MIRRVRVAAPERRHGDLRLLLHEVWIILPDHMALVVDASMHYAFEEFTFVHEERFEREDGPLRPVVREVVTQFLDCGMPENGFARARCPRCHLEFFVPFSCQTRNFCPSCQQKRALLFAEKLKQEILAPVPHRHVVFTIPVVLRRLFLRERRLLGILTRCAYETVRRCFGVLLGEEDGRPGMVTAIQNFGSQAQWDPHS